MDQIARRTVIAERHSITYNEFATIATPAHRQVHGEVEIETARARYTDGQLTEDRG